MSGSTSWTRPINVMPSMPGMPGLPKEIKTKGQDKQLNMMVHIIDSMTKLERIKPSIILGSRKRRIAEGSGTKIQDVNRVLKQHEQMQKMFKKLSSKGGMMNMMRGLQGKLPPGMMPKDFR